MSEAKNANKPTLNLPLGGDKLSTNLMMYCAYGMELTNVCDTNTAVCCVAGMQCGPHKG